MQDEHRPVVYTEKAQCRDCYRCLRLCPVKAIRLEGGQASVVADLCIACGTSIRECPQGAKHFRNDVALVRQLIRSGQPVAASVAPSFAGVLQPWERHRLAAGLRQLGFAHISETAIGAWHVALQSAQLAATAPDQPKLCTACPSMVRYVTAYRPPLAKWLLPVSSPMVSHARWLKARRPELLVVFIGPCVAKKVEAEASEGSVDAALTFTEVQEWFAQEGVDLATLEESTFDDPVPQTAALFPLPGGLVEASGMHHEHLLSPRHLCVTGFAEIRDALDSLQEHPHDLLVEGLFCPHGCINGPGISAALPLFDRRLAVLDYARRQPTTTEAPPLETHLTHADFRHERPPQHDVTDEAIRSLLEETGKARPEDRLNCGACGYATCIDKARAVLLGMAEREMCLPLMRRLAEKRTDRIIESSPNGIVIVDERLTILHMNPTFRRFFLCSDAVLGKKIAYLFDPDPFEQLAAGTTLQVERTSRHDAYHLVCHEIFYALREEKQFVGIFVNITHSQQNKEKLHELRSHTIQQAQELLRHQLQMAQQMARFLGDSTAQGEALVKNLLQLAVATDDHHDR